MAEYGKVYKMLWRNDKFRQLSEDGRMLVIYLFTSPHCNTCGIYRIPEAYAADDLQWIPKRFKQQLREPLMEHFIKYDEAAQVVLVVDWFKFNPISNGNQAKKAASEITEVPKSFLFQQLKPLPEWFNKPYMEPLRERLDERFGNPETESEAEYETEAEAETETECLSGKNPDHKETKEKPEKPAPNPDVKIISQYFGDKYQKELGIPYVSNFGKDGAIIKGLLKIYKPDQIQKLIDKLLTTEDQFINSTDRGIGILKSQVNKLAQWCREDKKLLDAVQMRKPVESEPELTPEEVEASDIARQKAVQEFKASQVEG